MKKSKKVMTACVLTVITAAILLFSQALLMPKYMSGVLEGALISEYYNETGTHDVIFIGDCEVYENISPITLWEEYGITSYIRGSAQQLIWQSYYLLEDTLKYEKPKVVVFNVLSMKYDEPQNEAYNRMTLDGMRWSSSKAEAVKASMTEEESFISYVFPLLRYHSRWSELSSDDFKYIFTKDTVSHNGYLMRVDTKPVTTLPKAPVLSDYTFGENSYKYLDLMTKLCKDNDIQLILMKAPSIYPAWYDEWDEQIERYAADNGLLYFNFLETMDEAGIDLTEDTYDAGLHLNLSGAEKLSSYFGQALVSECNLTDHRNEPDTASIWQEKTEAYEAEKAAQYKELEETGKIDRDTRNGNQ